MLTPSPGFGQASNISAPAGENTSEPLTTTLNTASALADTFSRQDFFWPPVNTDQTLVIPRLIIDDLPRDWDAELTLDEKKSLFIRLVLPLVLLTNEQILAKRARVLDAVATGQLENARQSEWFRQLLNDYELPADTDIETILRRVDIIPPSLALSQAILESGWGTSRFTERGNALYAEWIWGEGIEPRQRREELGDYGVESFSSLLRSAFSYANNLNSNTDYRSFHLQRAARRAEDLVLDGCILASNLENYSELSGDEYRERLCTLISQNQLGLTDGAVLEPRSVELLEFKAQGN